jgi:hypothetical protein
VALDGRLDEAAWRDAPPFGDFVQIFPDEGAAPTERTEVRVLYDDRTLYVGVRCLDARPEEIVAQLGRRDSPPAGDSVTLIIDSNNDRRTAAQFQLTAGGVQADALVFDDDRSTPDWDAVWDGAAALLPDGWSAEFAIPHSALRLAAAEPAWGFGVVREIGRSHEKSATVLIPRNARGVVSRLGQLTGLEGLAPGHDLRLAPYLAGRLVHRPRSSDASLPRPRILDPSADAGLDFRARLGSFVLAGALNPDFGQVEADEIIVNLTTFETQFPEKRPFFTEGLDLFQPPGAGDVPAPPQQMFYSRRIGLETPILAAAKLAGRAGERWRLGFLEALVAGTGQRDAQRDYPDVDAAEAHPDRRLRWTPHQPLRLAPGSAFPLVPPVAENFLAGVARYQATSRLHLGAQATSALPLASSCTAADDAQPDLRRPATCDLRAGNAAALDLNLTSPDGEWYAYGQAAASQSLGGPPVRLFPDGATLRRGGTGAGGYLRAGRRGGEPWRFDLGWSWSSPGLDLNPSGYQRTQNEQEGRVTLKYARPSGGGPLHDWTARLDGVARWTTDGRGLLRGGGVEGGVEARLKDSYLYLGCAVLVEAGQWDVREIEETGIPLRRPGWTVGGCDLATDEARALSLKGSAWLGRNASYRPLEVPWFWGADAALAVRPHPRLETRLALHLEDSVFAIRHVESASAAGFRVLRFARLTAPVFSATLRQLVALTPRLTFQLYAQLVSYYQLFGPFYEVTRGAADLSPLRPEQLRRVALGPGDFIDGDPDVHQTELVVNAVLRWEVRPGSTFYAVYGRNQAELPAGDGVPRSHQLAPRGLASGPTTDSLLLKWSYWFGP